MPEAGHRYQSRKDWSKTHTSWEPRVIARKRIRQIAVVGDLAVKLEDLTTPSATQRNRISTTNKKVTKYKSQLQVGFVLG